MDQALDLLSQVGDIIHQERKHAKKCHQEITKCRLAYNDLSEENNTLRKQLSAVALLPGPDPKRLKQAQVATDTRLATDISHKESPEF